MAKKICNIVLIVGGLLALVGATVAGLNLGVRTNMPVSAFYAMAILARISAIMLLVGGIGVLAFAFKTADAKKGRALAGTVARMVFGVAAFVGQFLINPFTSENAMLRTIEFYTKTVSGEFPNGSNLEANLLTTALVGFFIIAVSGFVLLIMGMEGIASKKNKSAQ